VAYQSGSNVIVAYKAQAALGTPASGGSGYGLRWLAGSQGFRPAKAIIENEEVRQDGLTTRGRHGSREVTGSFRVNLAVGDIDVLLAAVMRTSWTAAVTRTYDNSAGLTSLAISGTGSTITQVGTTTLIGVVHKGDLIKLGSMSTAANNDKWVRVLDVTATVITLPAGSLTDQAADTACTMTVSRKVYSASAPTDTYFTFDVYNADIDRSVTYTDVKVTGIELAMSPDNNIVATINLHGLDWTSNATGASPVLTSPTFSTARPLVMADGKVMISGTDYADISSFSMSYMMGSSAPKVLAPNPPDVFLGRARASGNLVSLRTDLDWLDAFDNETQMTFFIHMIEVGDSDPKDFLGLWVGDAVFDGAEESNLGSDDGLAENIPWRAGKDVAGSASAGTIIKWATSAA
jgi:hypothetical protein